jgi:DNA invertase Pin-like site-specific DNA recombinase
MLTVLGGLAEFERELIRARIGEGRSRAKARGVKMGRRFQMTPQRRTRSRRRYSAATLESRYVTSPDRMMSATAQF